MSLLEALGQHAVEHSPLVVWFAVAEFCRIPIVTDAAEGPEQRRGGADRAADLRPDFLTSRPRSTTGQPDIVGS